MAEATQPTVDDYLKRIPARRWYIIALRTDLSESVILNSPTLTAAIAANERHRIENDGRDDFERFLDMDLDSLYEYISAGAFAEDDPLADGDEEDGADGQSRFPDEPSGVAVADAESAVLPDHPGIAG